MRNILGVYGNSRLGHTNVPCIARFFWSNMSFRKCLLIPHENLAIRFFGKRCGMTRQVEYLNNPFPNCLFGEMVQLGQYFPHLELLANFNYKALTEFTHGPHETDDPEKPIRHVTVLHLHPIKSAQDAVRAAIMQEARNLGTEES
jgi:hypothetical protein